MLTLDIVSDGEEVKVVEIKGGRGVVTRLYELGLVPGAKIKVFKSNKPGPMVIEVKGTKVAIGRGAARKIVVEKA